MDRNRRDQMIELLRETPRRVAELIAKVPAAERTRKPAADSFSVREQVHHLHDIETEGFAVRLDRLLREENPSLPGIDGDALARERRYNERPYDEALEEFTGVRMGCVARLERLTPTEWQRAGELVSVGRVTIERLAELWREHDADHIEQMRRLADDHEGPREER